ncbi:MAG: hypothetical protein GF334_01970 [Candidatus Altiarchaeales archaeon]|nr:hypothetical protein [Candidatus Altiarchaeales archaeon]
MHNILPARHRLRRNPEQLRKKMTLNPYKPVKTQVVGLQQLEGDYLMATLQTVEEGFNTSFQSGQYVMASIPGFGETPHPLASAPGNPRIKIPVKTRHEKHFQLQSYVGVRGPYGRGVPEKTMENNLVAVASGEGIFPLRSLLLGHKPHKLFEYKILLQNDYGSAMETELRNITDRTNLRIFETPEPLLEYLTNINLPIPSNALLLTPENMYPKILPHLKDSGVFEKDTLIYLLGDIVCGLGKCRQCPQNLCRRGPVMPYKEYAGGKT